MEKRYFLSDINVAFDQNGDEVVFYVMNNNQNKIKDIMSEKVMAIESPEMASIKNAIINNYDSLDESSVTFASATDLMAGVFLESGDFIKGFAFLNLSLKLVARVSEEEPDIHSYIENWANNCRVSPKQLRPFAEQLKEELKELNMGEATNERDF